METRLVLVQPVEKSILKGRTEDIVSEPKDIAVDEAEDEDARQPQTTRVEGLDVGLFSGTKRI